MVTTTTTVGTMDVRVISESSLVSDLRKEVSSIAKLKPKLIEEFAHEAMCDMCGKSITRQYYDELLKSWGASLIDYSKQTPYQYYLVSHEMEIIRNVNPNE